MGVAYANGNGVRIDYVEAFKWYLLALEETPESDHEGRLLVSENLERVMAKLSEDEIAEGRRRYEAWPPSE